MLRRRPNGIATLLSEREAHYGRVLTILDEAIGSIRESGATDSSAEHVQTGNAEPLASNDKVGPDPCLLPLNHSTRICELLAKATPIPDSLPNPSPCLTQQSQTPVVELPRRPARIQKHPLEEETCLELPLPKIRRSNDRP